MKGRMQQHTTNYKDVSQEDRGEGKKEANWDDKVQRGSCECLFGMEVECETQVNCFET